MMCSFSLSLESVTGSVRCYFSVTKKDLSSSFFLSFFSRAFTRRRRRRHFHHDGNWCCFVRINGLECRPNDHTVYPTDNKQHGHWVVLRTVDRSGSYPIDIIVQSRKTETRDERELRSNDVTTRFPLLFQPSSQPSAANPNNNFDPSRTTYGNGLSSPSPLSHVPHSQQQQLSETNLYIKNLPPEYSDKDLAALVEG